MESYSVTVPVDFGLIELHNSNGGEGKPRCEEPCYGMRNLDPVPTSAASNETMESAVAAGQPAS